MASDERESFADRVRSVLAQRDLTIAMLADGAELAPSLISKLLTETVSARREPRIEHVLAISRVLELAPSQLLLGTTAETLLREWVSREEFEKESNERSNAQAAAANARTELAGRSREVEALQASVDRLLHELAESRRHLGAAESAARREAATARASQAGAEARLAAALVERDRALELARRNYDAWAAARSYLEQVRRELAQSKSAESTGWVAALIAMVGGLIVAGAAAEPSK